jgi:hypothetical protein
MAVQRGAVYQTGGKMMTEWAIGKRLELATRMLTFTQLGPVRRSHRGVRRSN